MSKELTDKILLKYISKSLKNELTQKDIENIIEMDKKITSKDDNNELTEMDLKYYIMGWHVYNIISTKEKNDEDN